MASTWYLSMVSCGYLWCLCGVHVVSFSGILLFPVVSLLCLCGIFLWCLVYCCVFLVSFCGVMLFLVVSLWLCYHPFAWFMA